MIYALANAIARRFNVVVSPVDMFACGNIDDLFRLIELNDTGTAKTAL
jgi:hypothetical protein